MEDKNKKVENDAPLEAKLVSILFFLGEPATISRLSRLTRRKEKEIRGVLENLKKRLKEVGLGILEKDDTVLLVTSPEVSEVLRKIQKEELEGQLTKAAAEALAIIIYHGPLSRAEIDYIRGVDSSSVLRNLAIRGLLERIHHPRDARVYLYKPSFDLIRFLGIEKFENLPEYLELHKTLEEFLKEK